MDYKSREEYDKKGQYLGKEDCPFCDDKIYEEKTIFESKYWGVVHNKYPYFGDEKGLIVFPKEHKEFTISLTKEELSDFIEIEKFMMEFFGKVEYFSFIRQSRSNKSVEHMHYHYISGMPSESIIDGKNYFKVKSGKK